MLWAHFMYFKHERKAVWEPVTLHLPGMHTRGPSYMLSNICDKDSEKMLKSTKNKAT